MPNKFAITPHASAAETTSNVAASIDLGDRTLIQLTLSVSAITSGASITVTIEHSLTGGDWDLIASFEPLTALAGRQLMIPDARRFIRARWTITGTTPSVTFALAGVAHQLYCVPSDIAKYGIPAAAIQFVSQAQLGEVCLSASDEAAGYLSGGFTLPLTSWDEDLRKHVARMAAFDLVTFRGFDPGSGKDDSFQNNRSAAIAWLSRIQDGKLRPPGIVDATPLVREVAAYVASGPPRGWGC